MPNEFMDYLADSLNQDRAFIAEVENRVGGEHGELAAINVDNITLVDYSSDSKEAIIKADWSGEAAAAVWEGAEMFGSITIKASVTHHGGKTPATFSFKEITGEEL